MAKFNKFNVVEMLGITPISRVTDQQIWSLLVTPMVKSLLGPIVEVQPPRVMETVKGLFPGDEVSNLNDHRLFGGQTGYTRFPYIHSFYKTANGAFIVKRDGVKFEALCWFGQVEKGKAELIYKVALRDRRFDGTPRANDCALVEFVGYDDPNLNAPLPFDTKSVEMSVYGFLPGSRVLDATGEKEFDHFVQHPFAFLDRPELFIAYFKRAWATTRAPGQNAVPIPDVSKLIAPCLEKVARSAGYDFIEGAPSHYHVAMWAKVSGYRFTHAAQGKLFDELTAGITRIKKAGIPLTRAQESWVCVVQSLRPVELIPQELKLNGPVWPQDNIGPQNLWVVKPINEKAARLLS